MHVKPFTLYIKVVQYRHKLKKESDHMSELTYQANLGDFDVYVDENKAYALKKYHPEIVGVNEEYTLSGQDMKTLLFECQRINQVSDPTDKEERKEFIQREILV